MRATKNSKTMPHKFSNSNIIKRIENKKLIIPPKLIKVNMRNSNELIKNNNNKENSTKDVISNQKNEADFKGKDYNLDLLNQKYKDYNNGDDNINYNFNDYNIKQNEENEDYSNEEEEEKKEEIVINNNHYTESIPDDNNDNEYNNCINNIEDENYNNKLNSDIKNSDNIGIDMKIDENIEKGNIEEDMNNDDENKEIENNFNNIEIEEIEADEYNEKYNLPLAIEHEKGKEIILMENNINKNEDEKNIELNNNLLEKKNDLINGQEIFNKITNKINDINEEINIEKNSKEKDNNINDLKDKNQIKDIINDTKPKTEDKIKEDNIEEDYEDYILNTLAKLKKNHKIKPNKENKIFSISKYLKKEKKQTDNIYNPILKLEKIGKNITQRNNSIDDIISSKSKNNPLYTSPINYSCSILEKKINGEKYNPIKINNTIQLFLENELRKEKEKEKGKKLGIPEGVKFGIDETGNPLNISQFIDEENNEKNNNILIAYIIQKKDENNNNNYLVDKKGKILEKTKEGDYLYKEGETYIVIKDFDVQHPELRIYGHRSYTSSENRVLSEKVTIENNKDDQKNNNTNNNKIEIKETLNDKYNKYFKEIRNNNYINSHNDLKDLKNKILYTSNNGSFVRNDYSTNKINMSHSFIRGNEDFKNLMTVWRKRYGNKNIKTNTPKIQNNYSYSVRHEYKMVERTNSILKMASERDKKDFAFKTETNNEIFQIKYIRQYPRLTITKKYNIPIYYNGLINKRHENPLLKKNVISFYKSKNPLLKNKNILLRNNIGDIPQNKMNTENWLYKNDINKNKTFEYISYYKEENNKHTRNNLFKNILQKNKDNAINKGRKSEIINDYIYKNIIKINNKKNNIKINDNIIKKYSVLSNEANKLIKDYYIKQNKRGKIKNHNNILINNAFNNNSSYIPINKNLKSNNNFINKNKLNNNIIQDFQRNKNTFGDYYRNGRYNFLKTKD